MLLTAVSAQIESSEPGMLLLIVAGRQTMGMLNAGEIFPFFAQPISGFVTGPAADDQQT